MVNLKLLRQADYSCPYVRVFLHLAIAGLCLFPNVVAGQTSQTAKPGDREMRIQQLLDSVGDLQIEYRADIQLNAIEAGRPIKSKLVEEILLRLFDDAGLAKYPYRVTVTDTRNDTRDLVIANALSYLHLDTLSIRTRVVQALVARKSGKALQEFQAIHLAVPQTSCKSRLVPELSNYYDLFTLIGNSTLTSGPKARDDFLFWAAAEIRGMTSPLQLAPVAVSLSNLHLSANEFKVLADAYVVKLQNLEATDRDLAAIQANQSLVNAIGQLASQLRNESWPVTPLIQAYRGFLVKSAGQPACSDATTDWGEVTKSFNHLSDEYKASDTNKLDSLHIGRSTENGGSAEVQQFPDTESWYVGLGKLLDMKFIKQHRNNTVQNQDTNGWESEVASALNGIDALEPSRYPCYACAFSAKASVLSLYFDAAPNGRWKERVLDRLIHHLADQSMERDAPLEWLFVANILLNMSRRPSPEQEEELREIVKKGVAPNALPSDLGPEILQGMKQSGDRTLYLYAVADEVLQNKYVTPPHPD